MKRFLAQGSPRLYYGVGERVWNGRIKKQKNLGTEARRRWLKVELRGKYGLSAIGGKSERKEDVRKDEITKWTITEN